MRKAPKPGQSGKQQPIAQITLEERSGKREEGRGCFYFWVYSMVESIYLLCLAVSRLKGVLVTWPDSARVKRRIGYHCLSVARQCHSSVVAELFSSHGPREWLRAQWWLWVICYETKDSASWRPTNDDHTSDNEGSTRLWRENLMVCIWRCNIWLVWHHRAGIREMGSSLEK